jgi:hypothetical protein
MVERAKALKKVADGLLAADGLEKGRAQEIIDALAEAFGIARRLSLRDGIAMAGTQLARVLAWGGLHDNALAVLNDAEASYRKLQNVEGIAYVEQLREAIRNAQESQR